MADPNSKHFKSKVLALVSGGGAEGEDQPGGRGGRGRGGRDRGGRGGRGRGRGRGCGKPSRDRLGDKRICLIDVLTKFKTLIKTIIPRCLTPR